MDKGGMLVILRYTSFIVSKDTMHYLKSDLWSTMRIRINPDALSTATHNSLNLTCNLCCNLFSAEHESNLVTITNNKPGMQKIV